MSRINNYDELVAERKKIEYQISQEKALLSEGINEIKEKLEPFLYLLPVLNIFKKKPANNSVLKFIASFGIDLLVGQRLLSKSSWLTRLLVPMALKGVSALAIGGRAPIKENGIKSVSENKL